MKEAEPLGHHHRKDPDMTTTYIGRHRNDIMTTERMAYLIEKSYRELYTNHDLRIADVMENIPAAATTYRVQFDNAIVALSDRDNVLVRAECDRKVLTPREKAAAIILGGTPRHNILILPR
ncbi:hypothetical protein [Nocardia fluminea]|uniref:hypothetical protein n=1 Tax=Nocardia fluminea TaxID=134984 RepID=UPI0036476532